MKHRVKRVKRQNLQSSLLYKLDPFGVILFVLLFAAILVGKWWFIHPLQDQSNGCVACVIAILWGLSLVTSLIMIVYWKLWSLKSGPGVWFLFAAGFSTLIATLALNGIAQKVFSYLYYGGMLDWPEAMLSFLLDDFVHHSAGLYLSSLMIYSMLRIALCRGLNQQSVVVTFSVIICLVSSGLLFLGLKMY